MREIKMDYQAIKTMQDNAVYAIKVAFEKGFDQCNKQLQEACDMARQEGFEEGKTVGYNEAFIDCNHEGCKYCEFENRNSFEFPCCDCRGSHDDLFRANMEKVNEIRKYDICCYEDNPADIFCITNLHKENGARLFDAISRDGMVIEDGHVALLERVGHIDSLDEWLQEGY